MSDRIPFSLPGALVTWKDVDHAIGVLGVAGSIVRVFASVSDAPSGGDLVLEVNDATGQAPAADIVLTIPDGDSYATETATGPLVIAADETVYLQITTASGALNLSGLSLIHI